MPKEFQSAKLQNNAVIFEEKVVYPGFGLLSSLGVSVLVISLRQLDPHRGSIPAQ